MARTVVPIASLAPGPYVARAELLSGGTVVARTARPFTLAPR
jgi:hypothetical protein